MISLGQNWSISDGTLTRLTADERNKLYETYINNQNQELFWMKTENGIRFVHTLPIYSKEKQAIILSDISIQALHDTLQSIPDSPVYIIDKQGELLYSTDYEDGLLSGNQLQAITEKTVNMPETGQVIVEKEDGNSIAALYTKSAYNNWTYMILLDKEQVSEALKTTRFGLTMMGIVIMLLIVVAAYVLSVHLAKPIRKIQSRLTKSSEPTAKDEVDWILRSIDSIIEEKENLGNLIEMEKPMLETQFVLNLLHNRLTREDAVRSLERFGYRFEGRDVVFVTMLIQLDSYDEGLQQDKDVLLLTVSKMVQEVVPPNSRMLPIVLDERTQATILIFEKKHDQDIRKQILQYGKTLIVSCREHWRFSISLGISKPYADIQDRRHVGVPIRDAVEQGESRNRRKRERQHDSPQDAEIIGAVDLGGFLKAFRQRLKEVSHDDQIEGIDLAEDHDRRDLQVYSR